MTAVDAAAGFVGVGVAVVVIVDYSQAQATLGNVVQGGDVTVNAANTRDMHETTGQVSTGAVAVAGQSFTVLSMTGAPAAPRSMAAPRSARPGP